MGPQQNWTITKLSSYADLEKVVNLFSSSKLTVLKCPQNSLIRDKGGIEICVFYVGKILKYFDPLDRADKIKVNPDKRVVFLTQNVRKCGLQLFPGLLPGPITCFFFNFTFFD